MKLCFTLVSCIALGVAAQARPTERKEGECTVLKSVKLSFYGKEDHKDPIAYPECGRKTAGGKGTYESPLTMATAPGEFAKCEIVYVPYLLKYVRFEDICLDCVTDFAQGKFHMRIWTGNSMAGGEEQIQCEKDLTPSYAMSAIHTPSRSLIVDTTPLYKWGAWNPCALDHRYTVVNNNAFCFDRKDNPADHYSDERNSANAMRHPYPRPQQEEEQALQAQEDTSESNNPGWSLQDTVNAASDSGWALSRAPEDGQWALQQGGPDTQSGWALQQDT